MTDSTDQNTDGQDTSESNKTATKPPHTDQDMIEKLVKERAEAELKPIKEKLDSAFSQRDEALRKVAEFEKSQREAEIARLKAEGKEKEAFEKQIAEERAAREVLERQNIELSRNVEVRAALTGLSFRNAKATDMAFQEVVGQLVRNEQGTWVHRSGISISDFVKAFVEEEDNAFLFAAKKSSGSGSGSPANKGGSPAGREGSLFAKSQAEVLKMASEGKLPNQQKT